LAQVFNVIKLISAVLPETIIASNWGVLTNLTIW